jgi:hypothetical protein
LHFQLSVSSCLADAQLLDIAFISTTMPNAQAPHYYTLYLCHCAVEELVYAADTDFACLLPDIAPPSDEETDDSTIGEAAAADEADVGLAAVAHVCINAQGGAAACSSPVSSKMTQQLDQQQVLDCKSPMGMPW